MGEEYIYNADVYCAACAEDIKSRIRAADRAAKRSSGDSNEWPQGPFMDQESDCPQHCGSGPDCLDPHTFPSGYVAGKFLANPLTSHGREYVKQTHLEEPGEVTTMWVEYYELERDCAWCSNKIPLDAPQEQKMCESCLKDEAAEQLEDSGTED